MTHYIKNYSTISDAAAKDRAACLDAVQYLGFRRARLFISYARRSPPTLDTARQFDMYMYMVGVSGFPVFALIRRYLPTAYSDWYNQLPD